jgi:hypothetical protein
MLRRLTEYLRNRWFSWRKPADSGRAVMVRLAEPEPVVVSSPLSSLEVSCHPIASMRDDPWPGHVHDLSTDRIGLLLKRRFEPNTLLAVELQSVSLSYSRTLVARVINARAQGGDWIIGCLLASKLDDDELQELRL